MDEASISGTGRGELHSSARGYFDRVRPAIRGTEVKPRDVLGRIEVFNSIGISFRRIGETGLDSCQDCWAASMEENGVRTLVCTDGVGSTLCGAWGAEVVATALGHNFETDFSDLPSFDENAFDTELGKTDASSLLKDAWREMVAMGGSPRQR